jgi:predicted nuclease with TOPRIM domain
MEREFEHRLTEVEERSKSNTHRLDEVEKKQSDLGELVSTVKVLAVREEVVENTVKKIDSKVENLSSKSGKRWDNLINQIITIVVAAVAGFILAKIGM